jgi:hypothetical protein
VGTVVQETRVEDPGHLSFKLGHAVEDKQDVMHVAKSSITENIVQLEIESAIFVIE